MLVGAKRVSALLLTPGNATVLYVLAHGAGAGMRHPFMEAIATALAGNGVATLRYQFPYVEAKQRRPDPPELLHATVRAAVRLASSLATNLPMIAGGKSMGGRMTSQAAAAEDLPGVRGIAFVGFPLHPARQPSTARGKHLTDVRIPMLFLQGTRDDLASLELLRPIVEGLGARATLHVVDGADHGFDVLKRSGRNAADVIEELASSISTWAASLP